MGQEIVYCFKCSSRIVSADLDRGEAVQIGNRTCCAHCLPSVLAELPETEREAALGRLSKDRDPARTSARKTPRGGTTLPSSSTPRGGTATLPPASGSPNRLFAIVAAVVVVLSLLAYLMLGGGDKPAPPFDPPITKTAPPPPSDLSPRQKAARDAITKARDTARSGIDIDLQVRLWDE